MYLDRSMEAMKKIVATTMTCEEGKEGTEGSMGRVFKIQTLSKRK